MPTVLGFKKIVDVPAWRPNAPLLNASQAGTQLVGDLRNDASRHPYLYHFAAGGVALNAYNPLMDEWALVATLALSSGAGASAVFHPSQGPRGTIAAGSTTTKVVLSTALPAAVGVNQLANRGDGVGFKLRIVDNAAGASGKISEQFIVANTSGTTPTIWVASTFGFTPTTASTYELLSGRIFLLSSGAVAGGSWLYYDIATGSISANLATTNLPATIAIDSATVALSESHVPWNQLPGGGFFGTLVATNSAAGTLTGTVAGADAALAANQFRNFQVRIVQDTVIPTAVGQRRRITSHTGGASPVYTLASNWTVTPSTTCSYVVENDDDKIILFTSGQTSVYNYNITANTWDTTTWATAVANGGGSAAWQAFGIVPDIGGNVLNSHIYRTRGTNGTTIDVLDIAGAATGAWSNAITYRNSGSVFFTGTSGAYDPFVNQGRYVYLNSSGTQRNVRLDLLNRVLEPFAYLRYPVTSAVVGSRLAVIPTADPVTPGVYTSLSAPYASSIYQISSGGTAFFSCLTQGF